MSVETITHAEFIKRCEAQELEPRHWAFKCPICQTVQSIESLLRAGVKKEKIEGVVAFSCVGRWTKAGPHKKDAAPGNGCDWTLGGLFRLHNLAVDFGEGKEPRPCFEIASKGEAHGLYAKHLATPIETSAPALSGRL